MKFYFPFLSAALLAVCSLGVNVHVASAQTQAEATTAQGEASSKRQAAITAQNSAVLAAADAANKYNGIRGRGNAIVGLMTQGDKTAYLLAMDEAKTKVEAARTKNTTAKTDYEAGEAESATAANLFIQSNWGAAITAYNNAKTKYTKGEDGSKGSKNDSDAADLFLGVADILVKKYEREEGGCVVDNVEVTCVPCDTDCLTEIPVLVDVESNFIE